MISLIAAMSRNRVIGNNGKLLWHIPADLMRFRELTTGHPVIVGRKTAMECIGNNFPLPNRTNIVVTNQKDLPYIKNELHADSIQSALSLAARCTGGEEVFVIGGEQVYRQAMPYVDRMYLTVVDTEVDGDAYFPDIICDLWGLVSVQTKTSLQVVPTPVSKLSDSDGLAPEIPEFTKYALWYSNFIYERRGSG